MPTESAYIPGINFDFPNTPWGRFGKGVAGFGSYKGGLYGLHKAGMFGVTRFQIGGIYPALGLERTGLLDFATYGIGGGRTLGQLAGTTAGLGFQAQAAQYGRIVEGLFRATRGAFGKAKLAGRLGVRTAFRALGPAYTAMAGYQGFRQGGIIGGVKGVAGSLAEQYLFGMGLRAVGALGLPLAAIAGAGFGSYALLKAGERRTKRTRRLEMGQPLQDPFGTASTMRQRSLQALQGSQLNGRSALGSEAQLMAVPYMR